MKVLTLVVFLAALGAAAGSSHAYARSTCPSPSRAATLPVRPLSGVLRGDFDGNGRMETASIHYAPDAPAYCGLFLVVGRHVAPAGYGMDNKQVLGRQWLERTPAIYAVLRLGSRDIVALDWENGASNVNVALYIVSHGKLAVMSVGRYGRHGLSLYGSIGTGVEVVRCTTSGTLTVLIRWPKQRRWMLTRTTYRLVGSAFVQLTSTMARSTAGGPDGGQFAGCAIARNPHVI